MPGRDGTGPLGTGPNGRGLGPCGGGSPMGRGRRGFFGRGAGFWRTAYPADLETQRWTLEDQKSWLERQLDAIKSRLGEKS